MSGERRRQRQQRTDIRYCRPCYIAAIVPARSRVEHSPEAANSSSSRHESWSLSTPRSLQKHRTVHRDNVASTCRASTPFFFAIVSFRELSTMDLILSRMPIWRTRPGAAMAVAVVLGPILDAANTACTAGRRLEGPAPRRARAESRSMVVVSRPFVPSRRRERERDERDAFPKFAAVVRSSTRESTYSILE